MPQLYTILPQNTRIAFMHAYKGYILLEITLLDYTML